jgi:type II secretion system protein N
MRWVIGSLGSMVWSTVVFAVGMMIFFPSDWVKKQIAYQVQTQSKKKLLVSIGDASSSGLMGVALDDVSFFDSKRGKRKSGQTTPPPRENTLIGTIDSIAVSPSLLGLLTGKLSADLDVALAGGELETSIGMDASSLLIGSDIEGFQLAAHPIATDDFNVELSGLLNLISSIEINRDDIKESSGDLSLTVDGLTLNQATISGFDLEATAFTEAVLEMEIEDGKAKVKKGRFVGDLLEATIEGHITLRKDISRSRLSLKFLIQFDETIDKLAKMMLKSSRDEDGVYHFKGQGTITNPRFRADRINKRGSSARGAKSIGRNDTEDIDRPIPRSRRAGSSTTEAEREERRAKRRERLKKRRERMKQRREERRERERDGGDDYERGPSDRDRYDDEAANGRYDNDRQYDEEADGDADYNNANEYNNDPQYQGNEQQYDQNDPNDPNENMEDLGYIDE